MKIAELFDVRDQATLVTGGAGGIGLAMAEVMLDNGARVAILDRNEDARAVAADALRRRSGGVVVTAIADVADKDSLDAAVDRVAATFGRLDVVFANAGISGGPGFLAITGERNPAGAVEAIGEELWRNVIDVDLGSVFFTLQAAARHMRKQPEGGRIVVTTSVAAIKAENFVGTPYLAAKAGAAHLVRQVSLELARHNIRVNSIAPGSFVTGIGNGRMHDPVVQARFSNANPMHRMARPDEIKGLALFLASPASSYVTGAQLSVDGGGALGPAD
jgi:NAD(P)-dependent dehydrogenase (short-subunit alcohol dehydrogenase family)